MPRYTRNLLPTANIATSTLGLGAAAFGYSQSSEAAKIVKEAHASGINYFDTSPLFGFNDVTAAEKAFAEGLRGVNRSSYILATKIGWHDGQVKPPWDFRAERIETDLKNSLSHLQTDYVDVLQLHLPEILLQDDKSKFNTVIFGETLPAMDRLRQRGLVKHIGITAYSLEATRTIVAKSPVHLDTVNSLARLTLIDNELKIILLWLKERRLGVMVSSPLALGCLVSNETTVPKENYLSPELRAACRTAREMCQADDSSSAQMERLAFGYCVDECALIGIDGMLMEPASSQELRTFLDVYEKGGLTRNELALCKKLRKGPFGSNLTMTNRSVFNAKIAYLENATNERLVM